MDIEKAEQAKELLGELKKLKEIRGVIIREDSHWWALTTPDSRNDDLYFPDCLRKNFTEALNKSIEEIENELEEL